jgi:hypothetical protein
MRPSGLFWLWSGAVVKVEFLFYGTLIMTFGLTVTQAILAIIVGNVFYALGIVVGAPSTGPWPPARCARKRPRPPNQPRQFPSRPVPLARFPARRFPQPDVSARRTRSPPGRTA